MPYSCLIFYGLTDLLGKSGTAFSSQNLHLMRVVPEYLLIFAQWQKFQSIILSVDTFFNRNSRIIRYGKSAFFKKIKSINIKVFLDSS